jgi:DNA-binding transcriptional ArsR family regulator
MPPIPVLVALADPTRCRIVEILHEGAQPVHVLAGSFKISRPAISRHLRVLKQAKLISEKKIGRENRYALHASRLKPVSAWLDGLIGPAVFPMVADPLAVAEPTALRASPSALKRKTKAAKLAAVAPKEPIPATVPQPVAQARPKPAPRQPAAEKSVDQMGFDF